MTKKTKEETQIYLEAFLPNAVGDILESYQNFLNDKDSEKNEEFLKFHKACKAAITNIEQLLKLYKWIDAQEDKSPHDEDIKLLLESSRKDLKERGYV